MFTKFGRRSFLLGISAGIVSPIVAPSIVSAKMIMPVRSTLDWDPYVLGAKFKFQGRQHTPVFNEPFLSAHNLNGDLEIADAIQRMKDYADYVVCNYSIVRLSSLQLDRYHSPIDYEVFKSNKQTSKKTYGRL